MSITTEQLFEDAKLDTGDLASDLQLKKAQFVIMYNREAIQWLSEKIEDTKRDSRINEAQHWLITEAPVQEESISNISVFYTLPDDFLSFVGSTSRTKKNSCQRTIVNYPIKPLNKNLLYYDTFEKPSFEWEEGSCLLTNDKLQVYYTDYQIVETFLSYYKTIEPIDLQGYTHVDGTPSSTINPTYNKRIAYKILERVIRRFSQINRNQLSYQLSNNTVQVDSIK